MPHFGAGVLQELPASHVSSALAADSRHHHRGALITQQGPGDFVNYPTKGLNRILV